MFNFDQNEDLVQTNIYGLGDGHAVAEQAVRLHLNLLKAVEDSEGSPTTSRQTLDTLLSHHGLNLFIEAVEMLVAGRFDVVEYLVRPLFDIGPLMFVVGRDEELAARLLDGKLEASQARRRMVALLRDAGFDDVSDQMDERFRDSSATVQASSHVGMRQLQDLVEEQDGSARAVPGGRPDSVAALNKGRMVIGAEMRFLSYILANHRPSLDLELVEQVEDLLERAKEWLEVTSASA